MFVAQVALDPVLFFGDILGRMAYLFMTDWADTYDFDVGGD